MELKIFTDELFVEFDKQITDQVFLFIESNPKLIHDYLNTVANQGDLRIVNSLIAQAIGKHYGLTSMNKKNNTPKSVLIKSFEEFELL